MNDISKKLKSRGFELEVKHYRVANIAGKTVLGESAHLKKEHYFPCARGGKTEVTVFRPASPEFKYMGVALCNEIDNFNRKKGFLVALSRAFAKIGKGALRKALE